MITEKQAGSAGLFFHALGYIVSNFILIHIQRIGQFLEQLILGLFKVALIDHCYLLAGIDAGFLPLYQGLDYLDQLFAVAGSKGCLILGLAFLFIDDPGVLDIGYTPDE